MRNRRHRWIRRIAMSLAFAAIAAPTAQARIADGSGVGLAESASVSSGLVRPDDRAVRGVPQSTKAIEAIRPDDKAIRFSPQSQDVSAIVRPDDRAVRFSPQTGDEGLVLRHDPGVAADSPVVAVPATGAEAFDWSDAGIGAAIMFGFLLLAAGAAAAGRQSRKALAQA